MKNLDQYIRTKDTLRSLSKVRRVTSTATKDRSKVEDRYCKVRSGRRNFTRGSATLGGEDGRVNGARTIHERIPLCPICNSTCIATGPGRLILTDDDGGASRDSNICTGREKK